MTNPSSNVLFNRLHIWGNALWFNAFWFAVVLGAAHNQLVIAWATLAAFIIWTGWFGGRWQADARMAVAGILVGITVEPIWLSSGLLTYPQIGAYNLPPGWIVGLWAAFAICFNHCLWWLQQRLWLALLLGAIGSILSISSAERLGAVTFPQGWSALVVVYSIIWALVTPLLAWLASRYTREQKSETPPEGEATV